MIAFEVLSEEEKFSRALAAIYTLLLQLAKEKSELLQQNTHPKYNLPHGKVAHGPRSRRVKRLSPRLRKAAYQSGKSKR